MKREVEFDLVTLRERNQRFASIGGRMAQATREANQRATAKVKLQEHFGAAPGLYLSPLGASPSYTEANPIKVRITRIGPGELDNDGPEDAVKNVRDGVADWLGVEDRQRSRDRHLVDWQPSGQERAPSLTTATVCPLCLVGIGKPCRPDAIDVKTGKPAKMATGIHIARRTPWRVRIEVEDATPGADRKVVLASEPQPVKAKKRPKGKPDGDPGEELAARLLVPCPTCSAGVGEACRVLHHFDGPALAFGVHTARAKAAGIDGVAVPAAAPKPARTGVRKMAQRVAPPQQARLPLARCYGALPWQQARCPRCIRGTIAVGIAPDTIHVDDCPDCNGTGTTGMRLVIEPRVDGLRPPASLAYEVPAEHRARWGMKVTLYPRPITAAGLGTITVYALKGR